MAVGKLRETNIKAKMNVGSEEKQSRGGPGFLLTRRRRDNGASTSTMYSSILD